MFKKMLLILILVASIFIAPSFLQVQAQEHNSVEFNTVYPQSLDECDYQDLTDISHMSTNNTHIAYTTNNTTVTIFEKSTRKYYYVDGFTNIYNIKYISNNQLLVVDYDEYNKTGSIKIINSLSPTSANDLDIVKNNLGNNISLNNMKAIDIYANGNNTYIGIINNSTFTLYEFENQINITSATTETKTEKAGYNNTNLIAINTDIQLISYTDGSQTYISVLNNSVSIPDKHCQKNLKEIDLINFNNTTYLVASTLENIVIFSMEDFLTGIATFNLYFTACDLECIGNRIFLASQSEKLIESLIITEKTDNSLNISLEKVLLCSYSSEKGRFNSVNDLYIHGNTIYISDTKNNRIQVIDDNICYTQNEELYPRAISVDKNNNIYFARQLNDTTSSLLSYSFDENNFTEGNEYTSFDSSTTLGRISDTTITSNGEIYLIDYDNNKLLYLSTSKSGLKTGLKSKATLPIKANSNTQIKYIKYLKVLAIRFDNDIYLFDLTGSQITTTPISIPNCKAITTDLNSIYALQDNKISIIEIENNAMSISNTIITNSKINNLSTISYDIASQRMYGFNNKNQSIIYFDYIDQNNPLNFEDFTTRPALTTMPYAIEILNNAYVYDMPYMIGSNYSGITSCIGIGELDIYYRVLFNNKNYLACGFVEKTDCNIIPYDTTEKVKVTATNIKVNLYKYPTTLLTSDSDDVLINSQIDMESSIVISKNVFPISIDPIIENIIKEFYTYEIDGKINFIYTADVIPYTSNIIKYLHTENATIKNVTSSKVQVYADTNEDNILFELNDGERIYVENYDKHSQYTKIIYKDDTLQTYEGYIKTDFVEMDTLDNSKIILIVIIIASIGILATIVISYIVIRRKK